MMDRPGLLDRYVIESVTPVGFSCFEFARNLRRARELAWCMATMTKNGCRVTIHRLH
jgi:hypothetical protein